MKSFKQFVLESLTLRPTSYGTDRGRKNGKIRTSAAEHADYIYTYFEHEGKRYKVVLEGPLWWDEDMYTVVFFGDSKGAKVHSKMSVQPTGTGGMGALAIFSKVAFVVLDLAKKHPEVKSLNFTGSTPELGRVYGRFVSSPSIVAKMKALGWEPREMHHDSETAGPYPMFIWDKTHSS